MRFIANSMDVHDKILVQHGDATVVGVLEAYKWQIELGSIPASRTIAPIFFSLPGFGRCDIRRTLRRLLWSSIAVHAAHLHHNIPGLNSDLRLMVLPATRKTPSPV